MILWSVGPGLAVRKPLVLLRRNRCCPFFDFDLIVEREGGSMWFRLTGREGVKAFIREEFSL